MTTRASRIRFWWLPGLLSLACLQSAAADETTDPAGELNEPAITDLDRSHWAFGPLAHIAPPEIQDPQHWIRNDIDRFILQRLQKTGLSPSAAAARTTLLRRVTFDLTGLPPTPDEQTAFLQDARPDAWERVIDRLLASPAYGERWAQHWLDLARFAETDGFEHDLIRPNAWRYRDWVINALNADMPWNAFVQAQIAGDLLTPQDPAGAIPTGFLLCGPDMPDINLQAERRHNVLNEMTAATGSVFLGLQMGCAQCHDHKYDPISQADFYRLRACFESTEWTKEQPVAVSPRRAVGSPADDHVQQQLSQLLETARRRIRDVNPDLVPGEPELIQALTDTERKNLQKLRQRKTESASGVEVPHGRVVREGSPQSARLMVRGDFRRPGAELLPAFPRIASLSGQTLLFPPSPSASPLSSVAASNTSARLELAGWLTDPRHPLTLRVIANRLWQFHFGEGLVRTPSDFGVMGDAPSHGHLLDWLAAELPRQDWSLKRMHRMLLTSATWRQASVPVLSSESDPGTQTERRRWQQATQVDPENRLLWRMHRQRLDGEALRDAMLLISGRLNRKTGGPGVRPPLPQELVATLLKNQWQVTADESEHSRRSIYLFVRRNLRFPLFEAFDRPDTNASCPRRNRSTIAPQALVLLNSEPSLQAARDFAGRLRHECRSDVAETVSLAFQWTLGRLPEDHERAVAEEFLSQQTERILTESRDPGSLALPSGMVTDGESDRSLAAAAALTDLCLALYNLNEFAFVE